MSMCCIIAVAALCYGKTSCPNGGTCMAPDNCQCKGGFSGQRCEGTFSEYQVNIKTTAPLL